MAARIVKTPGTCSGDARLDGHRIKVRDILWHLEGFGMSPEEVTDALNITLEEVTAAVDYYHRHPKEIEAEEARANAIVEETQKKYPSLVKAKLAAARAVSSA